MYFTAVNSERSGQSRPQAENANGKQTVSFDLFFVELFLYFFLTVLILLRISLQNEEYFDIKWYVTYTSALDFGVCILG